MNLYIIAQAGEITYSLRVFAHESAKLRIVRASAVLVEVKGRRVIDTAVCGCVLTTGKQETVVVVGVCSSIPVRVVNCGRAEGVVAVSLNHGGISCGISQQHHTAFVVLVQEIGVRTGNPFQDLVDAFAIQIRSDQRVITIILQYWLLPVVYVIGRRADSAVNAAPQEDRGPSNKAYPAILAIVSWLRLTGRCLRECCLSHV